MATQRKSKLPAEPQPGEIVETPKDERNILKIKESANRARELLELLTKEKEYESVLEESKELSGNIQITRARLLEILESIDGLEKDAVSGIRNEVEKLLVDANKLVKRAKTEKQKVESMKVEPAELSEPEEPTSGLVSDASVEVKKALPASTERVVGLPYVPVAKVEEPKKENVLSALETPPLVTPRPHRDPFEITLPEFNLRQPETPLAVTTGTADELPDVDMMETPDELNENESGLFFADEILEAIGADRLKNLLDKFTTNTPEQIKEDLKKLFTAPLDDKLLKRLRASKKFGDNDQEINNKFILWWQGSGTETEGETIGHELFYNAFQYQLISEIERQAASDPALQAVEKSKFWSKGSLIRMVRAILPGAGVGLAATATFGTGGLTLIATAFVGVALSRILRSGNVQLEREEKGGHKKTVEGGNWFTRSIKKIGNKFSSTGERREEVDTARLSAVTSAIESFKAKFLGREDNPEAAAEMMSTHLATSINEGIKGDDLYESGLKAKQAHVDALKKIAERAEARKAQAGGKQTEIEARGKLAEYLVATLDFNNDKMRHNEVVAEAEREIAGKNSGLRVVLDEIKKGNLLNLGFGSGKILSSEWFIGTAVEGTVVATTVLAGAAGTALTAGKAWWAGLIARAGSRAVVAGAFGAYEGVSGFGVKEKEEYAKKLLVETREKLDEAKKDFKKINTENLSEGDEAWRNLGVNLVDLEAINRVADGGEFKELKLFETAEGQRLYTEMQQFFAMAERDLKYDDDFNQKVAEARNELVSSRQREYKLDGKTGEKVRTALASGVKRAGMVAAISAGIEGGRLAFSEGVKFTADELKHLIGEVKGGAGSVSHGTQGGGATGSSESSTTSTNSKAIAPEAQKVTGSTGRVIQPEPAPTPASEPPPKVVTVATHVAGTGHDKGSLIGSMQAMQEKLTPENLAAIRAHHQEWAKLGDAKLIDRWRIEMAKEHGQTFDREGQYFKTVFKKGDVVSLVQDSDNYPRIELNKTHELAHPDFVPRGGVHAVAEVVPKSTTAAKLANDINTGHAKIPASVLPEGAKVTHADFNPNYPNMVDLSVVDAQGEFQHHLYKIDEGVILDGTKTAPVATRVNAFDVGRTTATVGTQAVGSRTAGSYQSKVGASGGGGANKQRPDLISSKTEKQLPKKIIAKTGGTAESERRKVAVGSTEKRQVPESVEVVIGDKLRAKDIDLIGQQINESIKLKNTEKIIAANYAKVLSWDNKTLGSNGVGLDDLVKKFADTNNPRVQEWLEGKKLDWVHRTAESVKAMKAGLTEGESLSQIKNGLSRKGMIGYDNVPDQKEIYDNNKNFLMHKQVLADKLKDEFEPIQDQIDLDTISVKPSPQTKN